MQKKERPNKITSILTIDCSVKEEHNSIYSPTQYRDTFKVKPLRSTKNQFQMREMFFRSNKHQDTIPRKHSLTLSQLQREKEQLIQSIHILKTGAISAIAQKVDNYQRLKEVAQSQNQQEIVIYEQILKNSSITQKEFEDSIKLLHNQMQQERMSLTDVLQQKEARIEQLQHLVGTLRSYIQELQTNQRKIVQEMKQLENKLYYLSKQIQEYKISETLQEYSEKNKTNECFRKNSSSINSSIKCSKSTSNLLDGLHNSDFSTSIQKQYAQKMYQIEQRHIQEVIQIKEFYENKIANIRNTYNIYFAEDLEQNQIIKNKDQKEQELGELTLLKRNHSSTNRKNFTNQKMQIIEKSEAQVHILKQEISFINQAFTPCNQHICQDSSQFTREHFENPFHFVKQKSSPSINSFHNKKVAIDADSQKQKVQWQTSSQKMEKEKDILWQKTKILAIGLISGFTLTSVLNLGWKKKNLRNLLKYFV